MQILEETGVDYFLRYWMYLQIDKNNYLLKIMPQYICGLLKTPFSKIIKNVIKNTFENFSLYECFSTWSSNFILHEHNSKRVLPVLTRRVYSIFITHNMLKYSSEPASIPNQLNDSLTISHTVEWLNVWLECCFS